LFSSFVLSGCSNSITEKSIYEELKESSEWSCISDECYLNESIGGFTTKYIQNSLIFEINIVNSFDNIIGTLNYNHYDKSMVYTMTNEEDCVCTIESMQTCNLSEAQIVTVTKYLSIIDELIGD
jgi:hypothetical protein